MEYQRQMSWKDGSIINGTNQYSRIRGESEVVEQAIEGPTPVLIK